MTDKQTIVLIAAAGLGYYLWNRHLKGSRGVRLLKHGDPMPGVASMAADANLGTKCANGNNGDRSTNGSGAPPATAVGFNDDLSNDIVFDAARSQVISRDDAPPVFPGSKNLPTVNPLVSLIATPQVRSGLVTSVFKRTGQSFDFRGPSKAERAVRANMQVFPGGGVLANARMVEGVIDGSQLAALREGMNPATIVQN